ncbi:MAG: 2-oxoacid:acceptor oxidoreductase subunit alpha [Candidatus Omnitrophota bacterium]|nr:2-oxoacid:acceptor oxidoreductase subunit alpha [Candidatus Omnitrophota bacterium]
MTELTIKIAGEAGQGMQTIGSALCRVFKKMGLYIFANQDYMSRVRGGNNFFQLRISDKPIYCPLQKSDIVIALDKKSVGLHQTDIAGNGIMVLDKAEFGIVKESKVFFNVPFHELANKTGGNDIYINTVCCGVIAGLMGLGFEYLEGVVKEAFSGKEEEAIRKNLLAAKSGYDFTKDNFKEDRFKINTVGARETLLMNGNEAIALAAIKAGCKFYSGYPMTPSTSIMDTLAHFAARFNIVVEQAEDEIAAINMIIGASFAGARSMAATSGGGFALMVEGISLAGMTETPIVVVDAQRPAPATGFPTRTEQADLDFLISAGHGEFARVIYSPGTIEEAFYLTIKAFNIAEKYQIPVLIMTDQHLADSLMNITPLDPHKIKAQRFIISRADAKKISGYKRYQLTASGVSPRAIPSWINDVIYADSDEHNEEGHITEDAQMRVNMVEKRFHKKIAGLTQEIEKPVAFNLEKAETVLVGFGSTYGVLKEACERLSNKKFGFVHLPQVWPFPTAELSLLLDGKSNILTVENNAGGQLAKLLMREAGIKVKSSILRYDGRPFNLDYLIGRIKELES